MSNNPLIPLPCVARESFLDAVNAMRFAHWVQANKGLKCKIFDWNGLFTVCCFQVN